MLRRGAFNLLSLASLLLCAATVVLWIFTVHTGWRLVQVGTTETMEYAVESTDGEIFLQKEWEGARPVWPTSHPGSIRFIRSRDDGAGMMTWYAREHGHQWGPFGFFYSYLGDFNEYISDAQVNLPHWSLAVVFAILPAIWVIQRMRAKPATGKCRQCGYDLRASPHRCPECGTPTVT